ncbi:uncharacterized protein ACA1_098010 [Acanthamoeba castellanii str. Neff]|uniref:Uncharacterized protein n=1 Tax=Acanthamoeba castellanii (strain ATCC 30010 / Neff) TaxID=1257118 RepID=L8GJX3_ACACF|nr:uncharacterized protein ACA1_098010 [Acanthamoeba castellanii str. Neff]ELR13104.1 hypothetical protein ACA1_098010 [Acanthamoeba castellanii str. Neff]
MRAAEVTETATATTTTTPSSRGVHKAALKPNNPERIWKTWKFPRTGHTLTGYSRSADKTFFHIPELQVGLDAGMCRGRQPKYVFLTHTHTDHSVDVAYMSKKEGMTLFCPEEVSGVVEEYIKASSQLNWGQPIPEGHGFMAGSLQPVKPGDTYLIKNGLYQVTVLRCFHSVACVGYAFAERKKRLRPEYVGTPGRELGRLRKEGVEIEEETYAPLFVYLGDTSTQVYEAHPEVFDYPVIITECTFIPDPQEDDQVIMERAERDGHIHWNSLQDIVLAHPDNTFVLIHFSLRYKERTIHQFFDDLATREENPLPLDNVVVFVGECNEGNPDN